MSTNNMDWDLTSYFPEFNGPEMKEFKKKLREDIDAIREEASTLTPLDKNNLDKWEKIAKISLLGTRISDPI